jgi:hypothetical protein
LPSPEEKDRLEPKDRLPRVVVPIPPLLRANTPLTSAEPRAMAPLNRAPAEVDLTGRAALREEMVVEPLEPRDSKVTPVELVMAKIGVVEPEVPWIVSLAMGVVVPIPTKSVVVAL